MKLSEERILSARELDYFRGRAFSLSPPMKPSTAHMERAIKVQ
jgi:hypothetical protein